MKMISMIFCFNLSDEVPLGLLFHMLISLLFQNSDRLSVDKKPNPECQTLHINCIKAWMTSSVRLQRHWEQLFINIQHVWHLFTSHHWTINSSRERMWMFVIDLCWHPKWKLKNATYKKPRKKIYKRLYYVNSSTMGKKLGMHWP